MFSRLDERRVLKGNQGSLQRDLHAEITEFKLVNWGMEAVRRVMQ